LSLHQHLNILSNFYSEETAHWILRMRHLTTYERKASEAPEKKREEGSEALKQDLWIAILLDRVETSE
jgi:hypothetical protein